MNKKIYLLMIFVILLILPVFALETIPIKTEVTLTYNNNSGRITISGENLDWSKTINVSESWEEELEIILIREFGNITELQTLMETCSNQLNYSQKWEECVKLNTQLDIKIREMVNGTSYESCLKNLTDERHQCDLEKKSIENEKNKEIEKEKLEKEKSEQQSSWLKIISGIFVIVAIWLWKKYGGFKQDSPISRDRPIDAPY